MFSALVVLLASAALSSRAAPDAGNADELFAAIDGKDLARVQNLLGATNPNVRDENGETPLMHAARVGSFEICRALLWAGADANAVSKNNRTARDTLKRNEAGFTAVNLLLRAYAFAQKAASPPVKPSRPNLVAINDQYVDYTHPQIRDRYLVNKAELNGKPGVDDDHNGFVDDVYGWNLSGNEPLRVPMMAALADDTDAALLKKFVTLYNRQIAPESEADKKGFDGLTFDDLEDKYENPLVRQIGYDNLAAADVNIDDKRFTNMFVQSSHGTHVAGIVLKASDRRALLQGLTWGHFSSPHNSLTDLLKIANDLAPRTLTYDQFLIQLHEKLIANALTDAHRRTNYLRSIGAGIVNMSWGKRRKEFMLAAERIQDVYSEKGVNPSSIEDHACPSGMDLCGDLGLELLVAVTAEFALTVHENPDVLFVMAAGNDGSNNDEGLNSPSYLSRLFPNVITVAWVDEKDAISENSNYGEASVQVGAIGEKVRSAFLAGQEGFMSGTSMAAPVVAGVAAKLRADHPELSAADVRLIIERSVRHVPALKGVVSSGGVLDPQAASQLASQWEPGSRGDLMLAALSAPEDEAEIEGTDRPEKKDETHVPSLLATTPQDNGQRISLIGGFGSHTRVIMSDGTDYSSQVVHPAGKLPHDWIKQKWNEHWEITSIAGEHDDWRVVMSQCEGRNQKIVGFTVDQSSIAQFSRAGYRITNVAGYQTDWVFVLTENTGFGEQRYSLPTPFDAKRQAWIDGLMKDGFRITGLAGDDNAKDHAKDTWLVVMTKDSGIGDQVYTGPDQWPARWIDEKSQLGYRVTQATGYGDHWVVVMSRGTKLGKQTPSPGEEWSNAWIQKQWRGK